MSSWDSSAALAKLYLQETDSNEFRALAATADRIVIGSLARHELRTVFRRREAEGVRARGEASALYREVNADIQALDLLLQPETAEVERDFGAVLETCLSRTPPLFIRTTDTLHLASARAAGEIEFITADQRQRAAALLIGFTVLP